VKKVAKEIIMILKARHHWMMVVSQLPKGSWISWEASIWGSKNITIGLDTKIYKK